MSKINSNPNSNCLTLAVCDYPEHVCADDWTMHAEQQKQLGLSFVRLAEFSWAKIEPSEGQYDWKWLDQAIAIYQSYNLDVVLGTPTATPPAWLIGKNPEILPVDENGLVKRFGSRRHYDHASETYRKECARIVEQMARRYGDHPAVIGWQTDNELGHEGTAMSYGGASAERFPLWLEQKYQSLDTLNAAWGCAFWSQTYTDWQQIRPPNLTAVRQANPSHMLDYKRFCSAMIEEFQALQIAILRRLSPKAFITHNFVIFSAESDLYRLAKDLDFVAWDSYPIGMLEFFATWESEETKTKYARTGHPDLVSFNHDLYRGLKNGKDFWVMEQQCGHANWAQYNPLPAQGAVKLWTAQAWAHGASSVVYFRWRACHMAQEIMHSGLLRQDGSQDRGYADVQDINAADFPLSEVNAKVAILHDYDCLWIYDQQSHNQDLSYWHQFMLFYSVLRGLGIDLDIIHPSQLPLKNYALVVAPCLTLISKHTAQCLDDTAQTTPIVFGPRTAFRSETGLVANRGQFELIQSLVKCQMTNFDSLRPGLNQQLINKQSKQNHQAKLWCEGYSAPSDNVSHIYSGGPLEQQAAVVNNQNVTVVGALSETLITEVLQDALDNVSIEHAILPDGVRISRRGSHTLVTNFNQEKITWNSHIIPAVSYLLLEQ